MHCIQNHNKFFNQNTKGVTRTMIKTSEDFTKKVMNKIKKEGGCKSDDVDQ